MSKDPSTRLYFAYGSNLNLEMMSGKCSKPRILGVACLANHKLGFYEHSVIWDGAVETVVPDTHSEVWGILYQLESYAWDQLDNCEDVRLDGTGEYFHYPIQVVDQQNVSHEASMYKKSRLGPPMLPSTEYIDIILRGAAEQSLPESYLAILRGIASRPASYAVPRHRKPSKDVVVASDCDGCSE